MNEIFEQMNPKAKIFFGLDLQNGFWNLPMAPSDIPKTCFYGPNGNIYAWKVMGFGHKGAPAHFAKWVDHIFAGTENVLTYVDDLHLEGIEMKDLLDTLENVIEKLEENQIKINISKIQFGRKVEILGLLREGDKLIQNPERIKALKVLSKSITNKKNLKSLLGTLRYIAPQVPNLSLKIGKFNRMTSKKFKWKWNEENQRSIDEIIDEISDDLIRYIPDFSKKFWLNTDASSIGYGGFLYQKQDEKVKPVLFFSKFFSEQERKWSVVEREMFAIVSAFQKCKRFIEGRHFMLLTDHKPLLNLIKQHNERRLSNKLTRWSIFVSSFDFTIIHVKGSDNLVADLLSRTVNDVEEVKKEDEFEEMKKDAENEPKQLCETKQTVLKDQFTNDAFYEIVKCFKNKEQLSDELMNPLLKQVRSNAKRYLKDLKFIGKRLIFQPEKAKRRFYVKVEDRQRILFTSHKHPCSSHLGVTKTLERIKQVAWWPNWTVDVKKYVLGCGVCQRHKPQRKIDLPKHAIPEDKVWGRVHCDLIGPLTQSNKGNKFILHCVDSMSKFNIASPIPNKSAEVVSNALLKDVILKYGMPDTIVSDQGKEFINKTLREVFSILGVQHRETAAYHPSSNGQVERHNSTLIDSLKCVTGQDQKRWDELLPFIVFGINTHIPRGLHKSSFFLMHGRDPTGIMEMELGVKSETSDLIDWWRELQLCRQISSLLEGRVRKEVEKNNKFDEIKIGDKVLVHS